MSVCPQTPAGSSKATRRAGKHNHFRVFRVIFCIGFVIAFLSVLSILNFLNNLNILILLYRYCGGAGDAAVVAAAEDVAENMGAVL